MTQARLPNLGEAIYGEMESIRLDRLLAEAEVLLPEISSGPWMADTKENAGKNWLLASFGRSMKDDDWILTTDHVHASEVTGDAEADAKFCALSRNLVPLLIAELRRMQTITPEKTQRLLRASRAAFLYIRYHHNSQHGRPNGKPCDRICALLKPLSEIDQ